MPPLNPKYLSYSKDQTQQLLDDVNGRSFFVDLTEDEYEALSEEEKNNGNLYLIKEDEDE